jgi:hypothetical protein
MGLKAEDVLSTDYRPLSPIRMDDLFDGRLSQYGVYEGDDPECTARNRLLSDGTSSLWVSCNEARLVSLVTSCAGNKVERIVRAVEHAFQTTLVSEYQPEYWGYSSREECDEAWERIYRKHRDSFYAQLMAAVAGRSVEFEVHTVSNALVQLAKGLLDQEPKLAFPAQRDALLTTMLEVVTAHVGTETMTDKPIWIVSKEELAALVKVTERGMSDFHAELLKFLAGEPHDIPPRTVWVRMAEIARDLVAEQPDLRLPANRDTLLARIDKVVTANYVSKEGARIALARMLDREHTKDLEELPEDDMLKASSLTLQAVLARQDGATLTFQPYAKPADYAVFMVEQAKFTYASCGFVATDKYVDSPFWLQGRVSIESLRPFEELRALLRADTQR